MSSTAALPLTTPISKVQGNDGGGYAVRHDVESGRCETTMFDTRKEAI